MSQSAKSIFLKLIVGGSIAYAVLIFAVIFGGHQLWSSVQAYRTDALSAQREATLVLDTSVELKLQVQEWKNLLLRASDAESFALLSNRFQAQQIVVRQRISNLRATINDPQEISLLTEFETTYHKLNEDYQVALDLFRQTQFDYKKTDDFVRGKDRKATELLDEISDHAAERAQRVETRTESDSQRSLLWVVIGLAVGLVGSSIGFLLMARRVVLAPTQQAFRELKLATEQLSQAERMAALGGLVAGVAHEINTPIGVSLTCATTLQDATKSIHRKMQEGAIRKQDMLAYLDSALECSELMTANAFRAANLIQSFKQIAVDQTSEARRCFKLTSYIEEVLASLKPQFKRTAIVVSVTAEKEVELDSYPGALAQVISNLLMNALHHAFNENAEGKIQIRIDEAANSVNLRFEDNGKGIAPENLPKIFDPFFTTARHRGGTGLGLNIVFNIVTRALGGEIRVESELGEGTRFFINLPKFAPLGKPKEDSGTTV